MRQTEEGTFSMPSGDSSAAALFCLMFFAVLDLKLVYFILPLVMCGRVYYHCHWFGDTIVGVAVGTIWGLLAVSNFGFLGSAIASLIGAPI